MNVHGDEGVAGCYVEARAAMPMAPPPPPTTRCASPDMLCRRPRMPSPHPQHRAPPPPLTLAVSQPSASPSPWQASLASLPHRPSTFPHASLIGSCTFKLPTPFNVLLPVWFATAKANSRGTHFHTSLSLSLSLSRHHRVLGQLGGFSLVVVIVALFVPTVCPVGGGMWGIFGKPLKRAIRNTLGLHAVLTVN